MMRAMHVTAVVVGAGQAGLAMSRHLALAGVHHVVLERGEVASSWRTERWDSLRLLTPNWMCRLPGYRYEGTEPNGYMTARETAGWLAGYACRTDAPVRTRVTVLQVRRAGGGFEVATDDGCYFAAAVVVAAGASSQPRIPASRPSCLGGSTRLPPCTTGTLHNSTPPAMCLWSVRQPPASRSRTSSDAPDAA